jgi:hypothetical protein
MKYNLYDKVRTQNMDGKYNNVLGTIIKIHPDIDVEPVYTVIYDIPLDDFIGGVFKESDLRIGACNDIELYVVVKLFDGAIQDTPVFLKEAEAENEFYKWTGVQYKDFEKNDFQFEDDENEAYIFRKSIRFKQEGAVL